MGVFLGLITFPSEVVVCRLIEDSYEPTGKGDSQGTSLRCLLNNPSSSLGYLTELNNKLVIKQLNYFSCWGK